MKHIIAALFMLLSASLISSAQRHRLPVTIQTNTIHPVMPGDTMRYTTDVINFITMTISNDSAENFYVWIGHNPTDENDSDRMLITKYFKRLPDGNDDPNAIRLSFFIWDQNWDMESGLPCCVGFSFLKRLTPNEHFSLLMPYDVSLRKYYSERLVCVPENAVKTVMGDIPDNFLYKSDAIVLQPIEAVK
ncbi:MAG: hypothetical protein K2M76_01675 [Muribaculaceae bacterium]|nr:hypothetical protein [Muribaculaceae bacterium]